MLCVCVRAVIHTSSVGKIKVKLSKRSVRIWVGCLCRERSKAKKDEEKNVCHISFLHIFFAFRTNMRCISVLNSIRFGGFQSRNDFWPIASESKMKWCRRMKRRKKNYNYNHTNILQYRNYTKKKRKIIYITLLIIIIRVLNSAIDRYLDKFPIGFCVWPVWGNCCHWLK